MNKKGMDGGTIAIIAAFVLAIIVVVSLGWGWGNIFGAIARILTQETAQQIDSACERQTQNAVEQGLVLSKTNDRDQDKLWDTCDICVCPSDPCKNNPNSDKDGDKMPDGCDEDSSDSTKTGCGKNTPKTKDGRCVQA